MRLGVGAAVTFGNGRRVMAAPGGVFNQTEVVPVKSDETMSRLVSAAAGTPGYSVSAAGPNSLVFVRKYWPTWVIVVAVIGTLFFLIGLLALLIRETETLTITLKDVQGGTQVAISGVASPDMINRVRAAVASLDDASASAAITDGVDTAAGETDETKTCPDCAETIKAGANVCRFCGHRFEEPARS